MSQKKTFVTAHICLKYIQYVNDKTFSRLRVTFTVNLICSKLDYAEQLDYYRNIEIKPTIFSVYSRAM